MEAKMKKAFESCRNSFVDGQCMSIKPESELAKILQPFEAYVP